jgi:hypothetical protein
MPKVRSKRNLLQFSELALRAGVAELADAQDLGFDATPFLILTHGYSSKITAYLTCRTKKAESCSRLLILARGEVTDKLLKSAGRHTVQGRISVPNPQNGGTPS